MIALEVALDLDDFWDGAFDAFPLHVRFGLLEVGFQVGGESLTRLGKRILIYFSQSNQ